MNDTNEKIERWDSFYSCIGSYEVNYSLEVLFASLNEKSIDWAIWKSLENLAGQLNGNGGDIDILVDGKDKLDFLICAGINGFVLDKRSYSGNGEDIFVLRHYSHDQGKKFMLHVHTNIRLGSKKYKEFRVPTERQMLDNCKRFGFVNVLAEEDFFLTRLIAVILKDRSREDVFARKMLRESMLDCHEENKLLLDRISKFANESFVSHVREEIYTGNFPSSSLRDECLKFVFELKISYREKISYLLKNKLPRRNKLGPLFINIYGHDGAGKTTARDDVYSALKSFGKTSKFYLGRNRWSKFNSLIYRNRHRHRIFSSFWHVTSFIEILLRHMKCKCCFLLGYSVVVDRGLFDILVKYQSSPSYLNWLLGNVANRIDKKSSSLKILLVCDPKVAAERDGTIVELEIARRRKSYEDLSTSDMRVIDTTLLSKKEVASSIFDVAQKYFGKNNVS